MHKHSNLLKIFYNATMNQSATSHTTLSMIRHVIEITCDAVDEVSEMEIEALSEIEASMKDKLSTYTNLVSSKLSRVCIIFGPRFASTEAGTKTIHTILC